MELQERIYESVLAGDAKGVPALTAQALDQGARPEDLLNASLIAAMTEVGARFERREFFVPEMLVAARAMRTGVEVLRPRLVETGIPSSGTVMLGTVSGDLHDIGKNLVGLMMEGAGFELIDLGTDVGPERFADGIEEHSPNLVGMSALLTTTMMSMKTTAKLLEQRGLRSRVLLMVGGAPVSQRFADEIGADIFAPDAGTAVRKAKAALAARAAAG
jgi:5-methyltetrahydrofolate--homocysteine methyltransferase